MSGSKSSPAAPEPLGLVVHSLPEARSGAERARTASGRRNMLLVLLVCAAPVVASYWMYFFARPSGSSAYASLIQPSVPIPAVDAVDLDGRALALATLKGQWLLVVVADSACDAACETRLFEQRQLHAMLGRDRDRVDKIWLVSDSAVLRPQLRQVLAAPGDPVRVLRLPRAEIAAWLRAAQGHALQDHLYLVDPMGEWMMRTPAALEPAKFKRDLERLLRASASWDKAGRADGSRQR
jgi:hypothetical protein